MVIGDKVMLLKRIFHLIFINYFPVVIIHLLFLLLWILSKKIIDNIVFQADTALLEELVDLFILPTYLIIANYKYCLCERRYVFIINAFLIITATLIGTGMSYFNWGFTTGLLYNPDVETIIIFRAILDLNLISMIIACIIVQIVLFGKSKSIYAQIQKDSK